MNGFISDCRHALRLLARTPGASLIAVAVLAIGTAFVSAFLSLYVDLVLRPNPGFEQSNGIATIGQSSGQFLVGLPHEIVEAMTDEMSSIEGAVTLSFPSTLVGLERQESRTALTSKGLFAGLRPRLALGRGFLDEDHTSDAEPTVVLSYRYWQDRFDGNGDVLGQFLEIARDPGQRYQGADFFTQAEPEEESALFRIVGVMAESVSLYPGLDIDLWVPLERAYQMFIGVPETLPRHNGRTLVRSAQGVSATAVANEFRARFDSGDPFPGRINGTEIDAIEGIVSNVAVHREAKGQLEMFLAGSVLLSLVAAANLSLFLLAAS